MVSSTIWKIKKKKKNTSELFKDYQNSTSPKEELFEVFENHTSACFSILYEKSCYYQ